METDNFWEIKKKLTFTEICVESSQYSAMITTY